MVFDGLRNDIRIVLVSSPPALLSVNFGPSSPALGPFLLADLVALEPIGAT